MRWSIRTKIMMVLSALLLFVVVSYLVVAERVFREDKELLVFDTNRSSTQQVSSEIEISLRRVADKLEILAQLAANPSRESRKLAASFFEEDPDLLLFQLVQGGLHPKLLHELLSERKLKATHLTSVQIHDREVLSVPDLNSLKGVTIENRSLPEAVIYLIRIPIRGGSAYVQAIFDGRSWLERARQRQGLAFTFTVASNGRVLTYPRVQPVLERQDLSTLEPVKQGLAQDFAVRQIEFSMEGKTYLGLYQKTTIGSVIVISMTDKAAALAARGLLLEKTLYLSLFIFTIVFLISLLFANSLSTPLLSLVNATREIAHGNFDTKIIVDTGDEIGVLARSFSEMGKELKSSRLLLEEYNAELENKVNERTQELESKNADIRKQQEVLLRATRMAAVGEIAGQAAHEVLNPLTAMISRLEAVAVRVGNISLTENSPLPAFEAILKGWQQDYQMGGIEGLARMLSAPSRILSGKSLLEEDLSNLENIALQFGSLGTQMRGDLELLLRESHRIGRIVDGMRGLSRASKIRTRQDVTALVKDCIRVTEDLLARHHIRVETRFDASPIFVSIDTDEMRQVFSNLLKNALDAIDPVIALRPQGLINIHIFTQGEEVRIRIRDNGAGIRAEDREQLFQTNFTTKGAEGTGFGLSICRRFVREAGGELILFESVPGTFTEFEITLPIAAAIAEAVRTT